jgi:hypothetical protein
MNAAYFQSIFSSCRVDDSGCRLWAGSVAWDGYGRYSHKQAHRVVYEQMVGPIPDGMTIDHICFNRRCVEPNHLRPLSPMENFRNHRSRPVLVPDGECINGHAYTPDNTYTRPNGQRDCRSCIRARVRAYKLRRRAVA